jgi:hypothetical protein
MFETAARPVPGEQPLHRAPLASIVVNRRWTRRVFPFRHIIARDVFSPGLYAELAATFRAVLALGLSDRRDPLRFSRTLANSNAYAWHLPPDADSPLSLFYRRDLHDILCGLLDIDATGDVAASLHHHRRGDLDGSVHRDLGLSYFTDQPRADGINPADLKRCNYTTGPTTADVKAREVVRAATMIFYLNNTEWHPGDGGETGLYASPTARPDKPAAVAPPINNSLIFFESTPDSYHCFLGNRASDRNSLVMWLHRSVDEVVRNWGQNVIYRWS